MPKSQQLGSTPASSDTVESEGRQMKPYPIAYIKKEKSETFSLFIYFDQNDFLFLVEPVCMLVSVPNRLDS